MESYPPWPLLIQQAGGRPERIEQIVSDQNRDADHETGSAAEPLNPREHDHAGADHPDDLHDHGDLAAEFRDAARRERRGGGDHEPLDDDQPGASREKETSELAATPPC